MKIHHHTTTLWLKKLVAYWSATVGLADMWFVRFKLAGGVARSWKLTM